MYNCPLKVSAPCPNIRLKQKLRSNLVTILIISFYTSFTNILKKFEQKI